MSWKNFDMEADSEAQNRNNIGWKKNGAIIATNENNSNKMILRDESQVEI